MGEAVVAIDTSLDDVAVGAIAATLGPTSARALITAAPEPPEGSGGW